ncbi:hypothetical protein [Flectobacillus longus]|uniref:hypothetical protein n=1 Tax=Flectobacillus longus TaxID=2984207 RepID=UPI0024B829B7|nr:hypothetical protein [Flectobacillus longus]MDI9877800.1 hypothetical protein [Flectobacillus longus]
MDYQGINDFGARYYDKTVGRWWGVNPMAKVLKQFPPYNYNLNNPVNMLGLFIKGENSLNSNKNNLEECPYSSLIACTSGTKLLN